MKKDKMVCIELLDTEEPSEDNGGHEMKVLHSYLNSTIIKWN